MLHSTLRYWNAWPQRTLVWQFARRDILARYRASALGVMWTLITPLMMLAVYTFVFRYVFKASWPGNAQGNYSFALNLFAGMLIFSWVAEYVARAPLLVTEQPNLVTKVVFPLQVLPWSALISSLFQAGVSTTIWLLACILGGFAPSLTWLSLPLVFLAMIPFLLATGWLFSALGVYLRDLAQLTGPVMGILLFLTPVFFPISALPLSAQPLAMVNPLTIPIESLRAIVLLGQWPQWSALGVVFAVGLLLSAGSIAVFEKVRRGFADVI